VAAQLVASRVVLRSKELVSSCIIFRLKLFYYGFFLSTLLLLHFDLPDPSLTNFVFLLHTFHCVLLHRVQFALIKYYRIMYAVSFVPASQLPTTSLCVPDAEQEGVESPLTCSFSCATCRLGLSDCD
jgi:hypothetical protein